MAQRRGGGGTSFPQLGHGEHEKMSGDVVVLQCRVGSHGACMGSARAQREARGAIFKDVLESVARKVARNGTDFRGARLRRLSPNGRRFYKASRCCKSPFVRGARPNGQSNGSYRVRVHVARATESHNVSHVYRW